ncbi:MULTISPECIES: hypothetical protein [unclassified Pseudoclavibacter]|uniref:hypothetical protein n=1 Tax=unclassified Pseudoclavibacter TaxID=2615177 RepID=UPI001BA674F8|nr:hypothetical protein [Pseudoclavibacter sp. Marseille-Q4354]MBS3177734.1 hypothetical protein [Pseudoclavibacter sp. Marseille-Q4354]
MPEQEYTPTEAEVASWYAHGRARVVFRPASQLEEEVARTFVKVRADERAKRLDREQGARAMFDADFEGFKHIEEAWERVGDLYLKRMDAVLALAPEAREVTGAEAEAAVLAVEKLLEEGLRLALLGPAVTLDALDKHLPGILAGFAGQAARAALEAAREVSRA